MRLSKKISEHVYRAHTVLTPARLPLGIKPRRGTHGCLDGIRTVGGRSGHCQSCQPSYALKGRLGCSDVLIPAPPGPGPFPPFRHKTHGSSALQYLAHQKVPFGLFLPLQIPHFLLKMPANCKIAIKHVFCYMKARNVRTFSPQFLFGKIATAW
jgi:hypothetical protein